MIWHKNRVLPARAAAFSLVELLSVLTIILVLAALLFLLYPRVRETGRRSICANNLYQIGQATVAYAGDNNGMLPIAGYSGNYPSGTCVDPQLNTYPFDAKEKGIVYLLPYFGASGVTEADAEIKAYSTNFFCPSGPATFEKDWQYHLDRGCGYTQYCGWKYSGLAQPGFFVNSPSSLNDKAHRLLWSDIVCVGTGPSVWANHLNRAGMPAGANCLFLDTHVEWVDVSKLTVQTLYLAPGIYYFPNTN